MRFFFNFYVFQVVFKYKRFENLVVIMRDFVDNFDCLVNVFLLFYLFFLLMKGDIFITVCNFIFDYFKIYLNNNFFLGVEFWLVEQKSSFYIDEQRKQSQLCSFYSDFRIKGLVILYNKLCYFIVVFYGVNNFLF